MSEGLCEQGQAGQPASAQGPLDFRQQRAVGFAQRRDQRDNRILIFRADDSQLLGRLRLDGRNVAGFEFEERQRSAQGRQRFGERSFSPVKRPDQLRRGLWSERFDRLGRLVAHLVIATGQILNQRRNALALARRTRGAMAKNGDGEGGSGVINVAGTDDGDGGLLEQPPLTGAEKDGWRLML